MILADWVRGFITAMTAAPTNVALRRSAALAGGLVQRARLDPCLAPMPRTRPVRVCFLIDELNTAGTETQLLALIRHLDRGRVLPYLCLLRGDSPHSRALEPDGCPV